MSSEALNQQLIDAITRVAQAHAAEAHTPDAVQAAYREVAGAIQQLIRDPSALEASLNQGRRTMKAAVAPVGDDSLDLDVHPELLVDDTATNGGPTVTDSPADSDSTDQAAS